MKLKLKNFRCYEEKEFDFGDEGLTLISGSSGKGKSTIMLAIEFALFGTGTKLQTYGKRSCSVDLEINPDFKIFRQKCPNRLIVNDIYEDEAGEAVIRDRFGSNMLTCYIPQNIRKTFILMSPAERLDFLESLVSSGTDIQNIKSTAKAVTKRLGDEHNETVGSLKSSEAALATVKEPKKPKFHSKHSIGEQQTLVSKLIKRISESSQTLDILVSDVERLKNEKGALNVLERVVAEKSSRLEELEEENGQLQKESNSDDYKGDYYLTKLNELLRSATTFNELTNQHTQNSKMIEELTQSERQTTLQKMKEMEGDIWAEFSKNDAMEQMDLWKDEQKRKETKSMYLSELDRLPQNADIATLTQRFESLTVSIEKIKKDIELAEHPLFKCPGCSTHLRFTGESLVQTTDYSSEVNAKALKERLKSETTDMQKINATISTHSNNTKRREYLENEIKIIGEVDESADESLKEIMEYINTNKNKEEEYEKLKKSLDVIPKSVQFLIKKNEEIKTKLKKEKSGDVEELKKSITEQENFKKSYDSVFLKGKRIVEQIEKITNEISQMKSKHASAWGSQRSIELVTSDIKVKEEEIVTVKKSIVEDSKKVEHYKLSIEYCKNYDVWAKLKKNNEELLRREEDLRKRYASACTFKEKILEAESIAITNMITTINTHAQFYMDYFFQEVPISVRLVAFKETKESSKPQINLEIDYKGIEHDLTMLSGGELSRVILAFTLALAEIHHTPFVLLDESTSSLDQELTGSVVDGLKENFSNKLVLVIAHQVIQGVFDNVVRL